MANDLTSHGLLEPGAEVVRQSSSLLTLQIVLLQLLLALLSAVFTFILFFVIPHDNDTTLLATLIIVMNIILHTIDAGVLIYVILRWKNTTYSISPQRIVIHKQEPNTQEKIIDTRQLEAVAVDQPPLGKMLDYGTVSLTMPGNASPIQLVNIPHPAHYAEMIK